jgi:hypothetical protein
MIPGPDEDSGDVEVESPADEISLPSLSDLVDVGIDESLLSDIDASYEDPPSPVVSPDVSMSPIRIKYDRAPDFREIASNQILLLRLFSDLSDQKKEALKYINAPQTIQQILEVVFPKLNKPPKALKSDLKKFVETKSYSEIL